MSSPEERAAFINSQVAMMNAEAESMKAENLERALQNLSLAHGPEEWDRFILRWQPVLGYNEVLGYFRQ